MAAASILTRYARYCSWNRAGGKCGERLLKRDDDREAADAGYDSGRG